MTSPMRGALRKTVCRPISASPASATSHVYSRSCSRRISSGVDSMDDTKFGSRNERGEWKPAAKIAYAPVLDWPIRPIKTARWLLSADGFFLPWNLGFGIIAFVVWRYLTPSTETTATLEPYWIAYLLLRNALIVLAFYGAWHLRLYIQ